MFGDTPGWGGPLDQPYTPPPIPEPDPSNFKLASERYRENVKTAWSNTQETTSHSIMKFVAWAFGSISPSVLEEIWPHVIIFTAISTMVTCINKFTAFHLDVNYAALTMVATVVAFVISFHVNNCYIHWWEGRVIWSNISTHSRQLAALIWTQVPNTIPQSQHQPRGKSGSSRRRALRRRRRAIIPAEDNLDEGTDSTWWSGKERERERQSTYSQSQASTSYQTEAEGESPRSPPARLYDQPGATSESFSYFDIKPRVEEVEEVERPYVVKFEAAARKKDEEDQRRARGKDTSADEGHGRNDSEDEKDEDEQEKDDGSVAGMVEKKTFIGLIQAYSVALKHSLRGERGPFYSDLYPLISFLPKYNASVGPAMNRDQLYPLWQNGLPQAKWHKPNDFAAIPLTQAAFYDGYMVNAKTGEVPLNRPQSTLDLPKDKAKAEDGRESGVPGLGLSTRSKEFRHQTFEAASWFIADGASPSAIGFSQPAHHREGHDIRYVHPEQKGRMHRGERLGSYAERMTITTVELLPPRHPPPPKVWDYLRPLRIFKVIRDRFKTAEQLDKQVRVKGGKRKRRQVGVRAEIAHQVLLYLMGYAADLERRGLATSFFSGSFFTHINALQSAISNLEQLCNTPYPSAYRSFLRLVIWAYVILLPFQIYEFLGWLTIPATAFVAITYLGFMEIGCQLEMPFGYERSDLDIDWFVMNICNQINEVTAFPTSVPCSDIIRHHLNQPFAPSITLSADQILCKSEANPKPTSKGFAASYALAKEQEDDPETTYAIRTVRDLEVAMNQNARESEIQTGILIGKPRTVMEEKTGMEVAVLAL